MEEVFVPQIASSYRWLSAVVVLSIGAAIWTFRAYRGPTTRNSKLGQLLGPLFLLFGLCSTGMLALDLTKSPIIVVAPTYAIIASDTFFAQDISKVYLEPVSVSGAVGQGGTEDLGIIEFADGTQLVLAADEYDTRGVVEALRTLVD